VKTACNPRIVLNPGLRPRRMVFVFMFVLSLAAADLSLAATNWHGSPLRSTPFGLRPSACVFSTPHGSIVRDTEPLSATLTVETPKGETIVHHIPAECDEFAAMHPSRDAARPGKRSSLSVLPRTSSVPDGWIANAGAYYMGTSGHLRLARFSGEWTVPPAPSSPKPPETLYYFIGLEDRTQARCMAVMAGILACVGSSHVRPAPPVQRGGGWQYREFMFF
jgi:hypothetical protein